ncbi:hypothetical protein M514_24853, partial [Trichuris suis]
MWKKSHSIILIRSPDFSQTVQSVERIFETIVSQSFREIVVLRPFRASAPWISQALFVRGSTGKACYNSNMFMPIPMKTGPESSYVFSIEHCPTTTSPKESSATPWENALIRYYFEH